MKIIIIFVLASIISSFVTPIIRYYLTWMLVILGTPVWFINFLLPVGSGLILWILLLFLLFKPFVTQNLSKKDNFVAVDLNRFPKLDASSLQQYTNDLESAGFVKLIDFTEASSKQQIAFARLFFHPQHFCWAEVNQVFPSGMKPMPMAVVIVSKLEPDWSFSSTDRKIRGLLSGLGCMMSHPRTLWISKPSVTSRELLQTHLQQLQQIANTLNLEITKFTDYSPDIYFYFQQTEKIKRKQAFQRKNLIFGLAEALIFVVDPKDEWLGNYQNKAAIKRHE